MTNPMKDNAVFSGDYEREIAREKARRAPVAEKARENRKQSSTWKEAIAVALCLIPILFVMYLAAEATK